MSAEDILTEVTDRLTQLEGGADAVPTAEAVLAEAVASLEALEGGEVEAEAAELAGGEVEGEAAELEGGESAELEGGLPRKDGKPRAYYSLGGARVSLDVYQKMEKYLPEAGFMKLKMGELRIRKQGKFHKKPSKQTVERRAAFGKALAALRRRVYEIAEETGWVAKRDPRTGKLEKPGKKGTLIYDQAMGEVRALFDAAKNI